MVPASGITGYCWLGAPCYSLIALWFTRVLGLFAVVSQWMWLITPVKRVGWSVIRLVQRFADEPRVSSSLLMGATAGYLHIGLTAGLIMGALETIQPGSFEPLAMANAGDNSVLAAANAFSAINYFAFVCLTTVGFGDINPTLPLSRMVSVATSIAGPLYLAAVMGVLIGRFASSLDQDAKEPDKTQKPQ